MRRALLYGLRSLRAGPLARFLLWSAPEALPAAVAGLAIARAVDDGFLAGRPGVGMLWLAALLAASGAGAFGAAQVYRRLGDLTEPFRDGLVRVVVDGALRRATAGLDHEGALARLTHQAEIARDSYAGLLVLVRSFAVTTVGAVLGLASVAAPVLAWVLPPFLLGLAGLLLSLGFAARRQYAYVRGDERLSAVAASTLAAARDLTATGARGWAAERVGEAADAQARAEKALAWVTALRVLCLAIGGAGPLLALLAAGPWLLARGVGTGAIMGGLTYVLMGLRPALGALAQGLGAGGLRFAVTLGRLLDAADAPPADPPQVVAGGGSAVSTRGLTFAYGPHAAPVLRGLDLDLREGERLAVVGPSGIGKSTLAGLVCGLLTPGAGTVTIDGVDAREARGQRVLIPQEAHVFTGTLAENIAYHHPGATAAQLDASIDAVGARDLVERLGGPSAVLSPAELSAGERQLIALARAHLSPAPLAVLDEACCHLDPAAEERAEGAFAERGTLIVIAHRAGSALRADRVLVLDGEEAVLGARDEVIARSPLFRDLLGHWEHDAQIHPAS
ncbi:ABC transporter ATP-binding protein [Actinorhabdospora filicis]|uniref:ABC transporter ATP-binding protein n=1 Tax=Actinorhabdospora filicis TaxID=1785913 RepID=A0A9W6SMR5_9ACTN|nr:ATP-binding cassette domain-containing protein [Actinorhabdospora filicis]GLZ78632.1 ABC transporter ATP-binding protein [Actinorhabdospora filicis]